MAFDHISVQYDWFQQNNQGNAVSACVSFYKVDLQGSVYFDPMTESMVQGRLSVLLERQIYIPANAVTLAALKSNLNSRIAAVNTRAGRIAANAASYIQLP